ncbi:unnamed protein product [Enterobius vermicularis]|uniref:Secreted RxLR effector peptide protein n=1 Tax=Enterobius vermicularis TaxID=51028 RepID=A0A0N4VG10_ENTVE|nr:unnamed protein product [Enterobius vermicularis]
MFRDHFHILVIVALCFGHFVNMAATPHVMPGIKNASNDGKNRNAILNDAGHIVSKRFAEVEVPAGHQDQTRDLFIRLINQSFLKIFGNDGAPAVNSEGVKTSKAWLGQRKVGLAVFLRLLLATDLGLGEITGTIGTLSVIPIASALKSWIVGL